MGPLTKFRPARTAPKPPSSLKREGRALWRTLQEEFDITDSAGLALLRKVAEYEDELIVMTAAIEREGMTFKDSKGQLKPHPLLAARRDVRSAQLQTLKALNLDIEPLKGHGPGRPSGH